MSRLEAVYGKMLRFDEEKFGGDKINI